LISELTLYQRLSVMAFKNLWKWAEVLKQEDLLVEIVVRGDLLLVDYVEAYWLMGDLGARLLYYHRQLEEVQAK